MGWDLPAANEGWVACEGTTRPVVDGLTACPRGLVQYRTCLGCRLLEYSSRERSWSEWCDAGPGQQVTWRTAATDPGSAAESRAQASAVGRATTVTPRSTAAS